MTLVPFSVVILPLVTFNVVDVVLLVPMLPAYRLPFTLAPPHTCNAPAFDVKLVFGVRLANFKPPNLAVPYVSPMNTLPSPSCPES